MLRSDIRSVSLDFSYNTGYVAIVDEEELRLAKNQEAFLPMNVLP